MEIWVWWRGGYDGELLIAGCDGELGVVESWVWWIVTENLVLWVMEIWVLGESWVWWRAGCDGKLLRSGWDRELGVVEIYWACWELSVMESFWELGVMESWVWWRAGCDGELLRAGCDAGLPRCTPKWIVFILISTPVMQIFYLRLSKRHRFPAPPPIPSKHKTSV